jgi:hypothetical protein
LLISFSAVEAQKIRINVNSGGIIPLASGIEDLKIEDNRRGVRIPIFQGELLKRGWKRTNWKKRFFVLRKNVLMYYKNKYVSNKV